MRYERRIFLMALATGLTGSVVSLVLLWMSDYTYTMRALWTIILLSVWIICAAFLTSKVAFPLRTLSNLLGALREGDYSLRIRGQSRDDALGEVIWEVNALTESLRQQRFVVIEATALLRKIMAEINVALFGFDRNQRLQLINENGRRLLGRSEDDLLGCSAEELGFGEFLEGPTPRVVDSGFPGSFGRWELRRGVYREGGLSHQLVFLSDLTHTLHEEERLAWKRLIQILRHEINNSLTPIQSVAESLKRLVDQDKRADDWEHDVRDGLEIIAERSEALDRFISSYSRLTHLPEPKISEVKVKAWIKRVVNLEKRLEVAVIWGPDVIIRADRDLLEQLLINIVANAVEASLESKLDGNGQVQISWRISEHDLEVCVDDDGPGLSEEKNVFVPFYTTRPQGSGIGLALSRQIAEVHGGSLVLENHKQEPGCRAILRLPLK